MGMVQTDIQQWVTRYANDLTSEGTPHRFELYHSADEGGSRLHTMVLADFEDDADPADLSQELWDVAEQNAGTHIHGMTQRYVILVYRNENDRENEAQIAFTLTGRSGVGNVLGPGTERPSEKGLLANLMKHNEALQVQHQQTAEATIGRLIRELDKKTMRIEFLEKKLAETYELREQLLDKSHERELEKATQVMQAQRTEQFMAMGMSMGQLMLAKYLGPAGGGVAGSMPAQAARDNAVSELLKGMSEEEMFKVFGSLSPQNQQSLLALVESFKEDDDAAQAQKPEILRDGGTEEDTQEDHQETLQ